MSSAERLCLENLQRFETQQKSVHLQEVSC